MSIRFWRKPWGVKIHTVNGQEIPHSIIRRPDKDADGIEKWELRPVHGLFSTDFPVHLTVMRLPAKTTVFMEGTVLAGLVPAPPPPAEGPPETYIS